MNKNESISNFLKQEFEALCNFHNISMRSVRIVMAGLFMSLSALHIESPERQIASLLIGMREITLIEESYK